MQTFTYADLDAPQSREHFAAIMEGLARQAGADHFLVVRLDGSSLTEVVDVVHNGGAAADSRFRDDRHWTVVRMLDTMRGSRIPRAFGAVDAPGLEVDGYGFGVAAVVRLQQDGCVVYLGQPEAIASQEDLFRLMGAAQMCAQHGISGLKIPERKACPLTKQELVCLLHFTAGKSPKQTARSLGISDRTVGNHLDRARIRCGVDSTLSLSIKALEAGWIDWPEVRAVGGAG
jgi:DNA-binding CsgD family transcriptional regulator